MAQKMFMAIKDGDQWCFVKPDFIDLQLSESLWLPVYNTDMDYIYDELEKITPPSAVKTESTKEVTNVEP